MKFVIGIKKYMILKCKRGIFNSALNRRRPRT
jgi:hypothetical protein